MYFGKDIFSDANENVFYTILNNFKRYKLYRPKINYTINHWKLFWIKLNTKLLRCIRAWQYNYISITKTLADEPFETVPLLDH